VACNWPFVDGTGDPGDTIVNSYTDNVGATIPFGDSMW
jgi:hypothetical protein